MDHPLSFFSVPALTLTGKISESKTAELIAKLDSLLRLEARPEKVRILFDSEGGRSDCGFQLYEYFRTYPLKLIALNTRTVQSSAATAFLGTAIRQMKPNTWFMIHRTVLRYENGPPTDAERIQSDQKRLDDDRALKEILTRHLSLTSGEWRDWEETQCDLFGERAREVGFVNHPYEPI